MIYMNPRTNRFTAGVIALALLVSATTTAHSQATQTGQTERTSRTSRYEELPNFHQVTAQLYRGAQPRRDGIKQLAALGIKTVINLRAADDDARTEERAAVALGLRYFNVPMSDFGRPTDAQVERVMQIIDAPENQPVFVHCKRGADRTGTIFAVYRITHDGWTSGQAKAEANRYGMRPWQFEMKDYITDYYTARTGTKIDGFGDRRTQATADVVASARRGLKYLRQIAP